MYADSIALSEQQLRQILQETYPGDSLFPELEQAKADVRTLRDSPQAKQLLRASEELMADIETIPPITYSLYRRYKKTGYWQDYGRVYFRKRANLTAAALRLFLGDDHLLDLVQDYIWSICEETNWVINYHEPREIDLFSAETAAMLAQMIVAMSDKLADEICQRVRAEIERRVFSPYLARYEQMYGWYKGHNNWNGVCNGSIGTALLLLERDQDRLAKGLALVLDSLDVFVHTAFEEDGASTEGPSYWQYGLIHFVEFAEMLRQRTKGRVDILATERMKAIAAYPVQMMLSPEHFANFADCEENMTFHPGFINRLAERTGCQDLVGVLARPDKPLERGESSLVPAGLMRWNWDMAVRTLLWWDGRWPDPPILTDAHLPKLGYVRFLSRTPLGAPVVLAFKAGHNAENHNHNDVGSFILHVDGESFICDPGRGLYDATYFREGRYKNIFASSFGHSVPRIGGREQSAGRERCGEIVAYEPGAEPKRLVAEIGPAYDVPGLQSVRRVITLAARGKASGTMWLEDRFDFDNAGVDVEEAFITWLEAEVSGPAATLRGARHDLQLIIEEPRGAVFTLSSHEKECRANEREGILRRLSFSVPPVKTTLAKVRMEIREK